MLAYACRDYDFGLDMGHPVDHSKPAFGCLKLVALFIANLIVVGYVGNAQSDLYTGFLWNTRCGDGVSNLKQRGYYERADGE